MKDLPHGWADTSLGEITLLRGEKLDPATAPDAPFIGLEDIEPHTSRILKTGQGSDVKSSVARFSAGNVLYSRLRPYLNKVTVPDFDGIASAEILVLQPTAATEAEFVRRRIMTREFLDFAALLDKGDRPRVNFKEIAEFPVALPPLAEQQRIVAKVDGLTARTARARKELDRIPTLIARYKQRLLALAFSGELTAGWRKERSSPEAKLVPLIYMVQDISYGSSAKSSPTGKVPVLRMGNIQDGKLDWTNLVFTSNESEIKKYNLLDGDVLFNRTNSPELVGKTALYRGERPAIFAGYLIRIRCKNSLVPDYLTYCLNSPAGREYCWRVKTDGVSQSNINAKKVAVFELPLPPLEEQAEIVRRIESAFGWLDRMAADHAAAARLLPKLDAAILAKAFRGELVPQDPNDEPATVLLERIKVGREAEDDKPKSERGRPKLPKRGPANDLSRWAADGAVRIDDIPKRTKGGGDMPKSRQDEDVKGKAYLTGIVKNMNEDMQPESLFAWSNLELVEFYRQLSFECEQGWLINNDGWVKAA